MKVLHVLYSKIYTGAEKVAAQIIKAFEGRVDMAYCSLECEEVWEILDGMGIRHYGVEELTPATLSRVIREYRPDVIHAHDMRTSFVAALCCGKIPLISHIHNNAYDARGLSAKSIAYLLAGFRAKHIFWVSNSSYEGYVFHRLFAKKSSVLYNIIDAKRIFAMRDSDENTYDFDMIYLGRLTYQKDPQRLMRLSAALKARKPDIKVAVVGAGELEEETKALCRELDLQDNVHFLGFQSNPIKMVADSKAMILTSRWEGTPMCALEAMALAELDDPEKLAQINAKFEGVYYPKGAFAPQPGLSRDEAKEQLYPLFRQTYAAREQEFGAERMREIERIILLRVVDEYWMDNIDAMEDLKQGIRLRAYGQTDPVVAYKREGFAMFDGMINAIREETVRRLYLFRLRTEEDIRRKQVAKITATGGAADKTVKQQPVKKIKIGANDPCPCGSGKKYKKCCYLKPDDPYK